MNGLLKKIVVSIRSGYSSGRIVSRVGLFLAAIGFVTATLNSAGALNFAGALSSAGAVGAHASRFERVVHGEWASCSKAWCPFCTALKPTLAEEMDATDAVVFAKVIGPGQLSDDGFDRKLRMQVSRILKGKSFVVEADEFETIAPSTLEAGQECLVMGVLTDRMMWSTPMKLTDRSREYILAVQTLPAEGAERVRFFLNYLEDSESFLAFDAYDEFARAPYDAVKDIKADMDRDKLIKWVQDSEVSINRKRLYFTLIGVCGLPEDLPLLERLITSPEKRDRAALDSLIACYLTLAGADGVKLIEDRFLRDPTAEYVDTYAAVAALRFHGTESDVIPVPRIVEAVRLLLDRPEVADLVIADLARWKDWTVTDRLVEMFKNANEKTQWVRVPIVHFLRVHPDPKAKAKIEELRAVDSQSVRRALAFFELEAAMQSETDAEDAEFERQLKELELEKSKEQKDSKEKDGKEQDGKEQVAPPVNGSGNGASSQGTPTNVAAPTAEPVAGTGDGVRLTVFRPIIGEPSDAELSVAGPSDADASDAVSADVALTSFDITKGETNRSAELASTATTATPATSGNRADLVLERSAGNANAVVQPKFQPRNQNEPKGAADTENFLWWIVGVPVMVNGLLLVLAWSILNGSFSRLFC